VVASQLHVYGVRAAGRKGKASITLASIGAICGVEEELAKRSFDNGGREKKNTQSRHCLTPTFTISLYTFLSDIAMSTLTEGARVNFAACVAMLVATTTCMAARFAVRLSMGQRPLGADWVCLLSLAIFYGYCAVIIDCTYFAALMTFRDRTTWLTCHSYFPSIKVPRLRCGLHIGR
jgi:hypothetical protein